MRNGEVHATIYHGGARTPYDPVFLRYIAKAIHPEAFADVDSQAELERYYAEYLPIRPEGVFGLGLGGAGQFVSGSSAACRDRACPQGSSRLKS